MTTYLIVYGRDPTDRLAAHAFSSRREALAPPRDLIPTVPIDGYGRYAPERKPRPGIGGCAYVVENEEDVSFGMPLLVAVYNGLTGEAVARFESRAVGVRRLLSKLPLVAVDQRVLKEEINLSDNATEHVETTSSNGADDTGRSTGRRPKFPDGAVFRLTGANPWKEGKNNYARLTAAFAVVPEPRTVKALVDAGMTRGDIAYLVDHDHAVVGES